MLDKRFWRTQQTMTEQKKKKKKKGKTFRPPEEKLGKFKICSLLCNVITMGLFLNSGAYSTYVKEL